MTQKQITPCEVVNILSLGTQEHPAGASALVKEEDFQVLLLHVTPVKPIPEHAVSGPIIVQCLKGTVHFSVEGTPKEMKAGDWMHVPGGKPHGIIAQEDADLLVIRLMKS